MKVIIADSNDIVRAGLRAILDKEESIEVVGEAISNKSLKELISSIEVDVLVIDYTSINFTIDVVPEILKVHKELKIVAVTPEQNPTIILDALKSGVMSYVKKDCDFLEIRSSVKETYVGNRFFCGKIMDIIRKFSINVEHLDETEFTCDYVSLSEREMEIIKYIAEGNTNAEIAELLFLSPHTVRTHRKNIMAKLGVKNIAGIVMYAIKSDLVKPNKFLFTSDK